MNEVNQVLKYKIVPNDTRGHIEKMLISIISTSNRTVNTLALFTDNARADFAIITRMFAKFNLNIDVLQVILIVILYLL